MKVDVVIIGGGIIGLSVAYHLVQRRPLEVVVFEREAMVGQGATAKATGGMRHQFSTAANILLSKHGIAAYQRFGTEMGVDIEYDPCGYLFVTADQRRMAPLEASVALQRQLGVDSHILTPQQAANRFPKLRNNDLIGGSFCQADGSGSPYAAVTGYSQRCLKLGVHIRLQEEVVAITPGSPLVVHTPSGEVQAPVVVNAAGAYADHVAALVGVDLPAKPFRRQIVVGAPLESLGASIPFTVDLDTGWYLHRMADGHLLMGGTDRDTHPGTEEVVDWEQVDIVAQAATHRVPELEKGRVVRTYVGIRCLTPDDHAILGPVPEVPGFFNAVGLGGHGFMHAPAVGLLLAEFILDGEATTIDATPFRLDRFRTHDHAEETIRF